MNKTAIKNFAVWARTTLLTAVKQKAFEYEITEDREMDVHLTAIGGRLLTEEEKKQRRELIDKIQEDGYEQVMEQTAYIWFNRFIALRFMEVNGYLPSRVRVFTDDTGEFRPAILKEAMNLELDGLDREKVYGYLEEQNNEELYKYLLLTQCNALNKCLPYMFEKIDNYTELLFPSGLLKADSVIGRMISEIPEEDWTDQVQIIGWLYQYYNDERKNAVINIYKGTVKKEDIPVATQLFTTDWVVRYVVDNSLGRYWIERNPDSGLKSKLEFLVVPRSGEFVFVDEKVKPEEITVLDPCMGSAHFLVYAFEVLMGIYTECGWSERDAAKSILENNLHGLEIDERAGQLAYFAVLMKARNHNRRILNDSLDLNIVIMEPSSFLTDEVISYVAAGNKKLEEMLLHMQKTFADAKEFGSMIEVSELEFELLLERIQAIKEMPLANLFEQPIRETVLEKLPVLIKQAKLLAKKYDVVVTNPPYLNKYNPALKKFVNDNFKDYSGDLFSVFMYRNFQFCKENGYSGFMTPFVWMFIKTYENLRNYIVGQKSIVTLIQMEYSAFEEATVPICSFVLKNEKSDDCGLYFKLSDFKGGMEVQKEKVLEAIANKDCGYYYESQQANFAKIPGSPVAYWVGEALLSAYNRGRPLSPVCRPTQGLATGDNGRFLRLWYEVETKNMLLNASSREEAKLSGKKWFPYNKGGEFRKWYGNNDYIVNWKEDGYEIRNFYGDNGKLVSRPQNMDYYFLQSITWSKISSGGIAFRFKPQGHIFDVAGTSVFTEDEKLLKYVLGFCNSKISSEILKAISPTINYEVGHIASLPLIIEKEKQLSVMEIVMELIQLSKTDWDSYETSWDFKKHPLI